MHLTSTWDQATPHSHTTTKDTGEDLDALAKRHTTDCQGIMDADGTPFLEGTNIRAEWPISKGGGDALKTEPVQDGTFEETCDKHEQEIKDRWAEYPPGL